MKEFELGGGVRTIFLVFMRDSRPQPLLFDKPLDFRLVAAEPRFPTKLGFIAGRTCSVGHQVR